MKPTEQQLAIIGAKGQTIAVKARAGAGKTSTLVLFAEANPRARMLYVAFNKAIKVEAESKFPKNVKCSTWHGLAYGKIGKYYEQKLTNNLKPYQVASALEIPMQSAASVLNVLQNFLISASSAIGENHVEAKTLPKREKEQLIQLAQKFWDRMQDTRDAAAPMSHDGYLKMYQLAGTIIDTDCILFDEYQDANDVSRAIIANQNVRKIYVGDENQSIYAFRGAVTAMQQLSGVEMFHLTQSFRFGPGIAAIANTVLNEFQYLDHPIEGAGKHETVFDVDRDYPHTVLCRTNGMLFSEAVSALKKERPFHFVGGVKNYRFDSVLDAWYLKSGKRSSIRDKFVASFADFQEMAAYTEAVDDRELKFLVKAVKDYGSEIPSLIDQIQKKAIENPTGNEIIMTTGHRSKGLEWMDVVLTEDFTDMREVVDPETKKKSPPDQQEINLLYVAATRAMRGIKLPETITSWLSESHPEVAKMIKAKNKPANTNLRKFGEAPPPVEKPAKKEDLFGAQSVRCKEFALSVIKNADKKTLKNLIDLVEQFGEEAMNCQKGNPARAQQLMMAGGVIAALLDGELVIK